MRRPRYPSSASPRPLPEYQLLEIQDDLKTILMIKKNNYIRDLDNDEIEEIKYYKRLFKKYEMNLKI